MKSMRLLACMVLVFVLQMAPSPIVAGAGRLVHVVRFADFESGSVGDWLQGKGFQFKEDAQRRDRIDLDVGPNGLTLEAKSPAFGIMTNESLNLAEFSHVEIDWGVRSFPQGASYEQGVRNEAIMVIIFMGDERQASGSFFIPDSPFFIGLFLCHGDDRTLHPYIGSYFKKGGRYVCADRPRAGQLVTSRFELLEAYRGYFDKEGDDDPGISGIALALDTKAAGGGGRSSAFIREIHFYK